MSPALDNPRKRMLSVGVEDTLVSLATDYTPSCVSRRPTPAAKNAMHHQVDEDYYSATMNKAKRDTDRLKEKIAEQEKAY